MITAWDFNEDESDSDYDDWDSEFELQVDMDSEDLKDDLDKEEGGRRQ
jgi:hypothetical protein